MQSNDVTYLEKECDKKREEEIERNRQKIEREREREREMREMRDEK